MSSNARRYMEVHFHSDSGNFQVLLDGSDKIYTLSHINGPRGPLQCWDLHVGAKVNILGRSTTLMQANLETTKWIEFHRKRLRKWPQRRSPSLSAPPRSQVVMIG